MDDSPPKTSTECIEDAEFIYNYERSGYTTPEGCIDPPFYDDPAGNIWTWIDLDKDYDNKFDSIAPETISVAAYGNNKDYDNKSDSTAPETISVAAYGDNKVVKWQYSTISEWLTTDIRLSAVNADKCSKIIMDNIHAAFNYGILEFRKFITVLYYARSAYDNGLRMLNSEEYVYLININLDVEEGLTCWVRLYPEFISKQRIRPIWLKGGIMMDKRQKKGVVINERFQYIKWKYDIPPVYI